MAGGPFRREEVEWTRAQLDGGCPIADVVSSLLDDLFGPCAVVRSLVAGADLPIDSAAASVASVVGKVDEGRFQNLWNDAVARCGSTADEALLAWEGLSVEVLEGVDGEGYLEAADVDLMAGVEVIAVDRLRQMGSDEGSIRWFRSALLDCERGSLQLVCEAIDRLGCPHVLVPDLLDAARAADASFCRWPIGVIVRSHGAEPVVSERDRLAGSVLPDDRQVSRKWSYWLLADWAIR